MKQQYHDAIKYFDKVRLEFLTEVQNFPKNKRKEKLFNEWDLKEVIMHLTEWDLYTVEIIEDLLQGIKPRHFGNVDKFNEISVANSADLGWDEAYENFIEAGGLFIDTYMNLPDEIWEMRFWINKKSTPLKYLGIQTRHYENEHLKEIRKITKG